MNVSANDGHFEHNVTVHITGTNTGNNTYMVFSEMSFDLVCFLQKNRGFHNKLN